MRTYLLALMTICLSSFMWSANAEVYKLVDPVTGKVTYTDRPPANEVPHKAMDLPSVNTQPPVKVEDSDMGEPTLQAEAPAYTSITITQPADESTIPPGQRVVVVSVTVTPELQEGDRIRVLFNDKAVGASTATNVTIDNLIRGTHQIKAQIIDTEGKVLKESSAKTIYVKRASRLSGS